MVQRPTQIQHLLNLVNALLDAASEKGLSNLLNEQPLEQQQEGEANASPAFVPLHLETGVKPPSETACQKPELDVETANWLRLTNVIEQTQQRHSGSTPTSHKISKNRHGKPVVAQVIEIDAAQKTQVFGFGCQSTTLRSSNGYVSTGRITFANSYPNRVEARDFFISAQVHGYLPDEAEDPRKLDHLIMVLEELDLEAAHRPNRVRGGNRFHRRTS